MRRTITPAKVQDDEYVVIRQPTPRNNKMSNWTKIKKEIIRIKETIINCLSYFACLSMEKRILFASEGLHQEVELTVFDENGFYHYQKTPYGIFVLCVYTNFHKILGDFFRVMWTEVGLIMFVICSFVSNTVNIWRLNMEHTWNPYTRPLCIDREIKSNFYSMILKTRILF